MGSYLPDSGRLDRDPWPPEHQKTPLSTEEEEKKRGGEKGWKGGEKKKKRVGKRGIKRGSDDHPASKQQPSRTQPPVPRLSDFIRVPFIEARWSGELSKLDVTWWTSRPSASKRSTTSNRPPTAPQSNAVVPPSLITWRSTADPSMVRKSRTASAPA